ncbi:altered inheritance of mitochondria protein 21 [Chaetomium strumarium]|uniref:Altered inheritance of mitochondria protein 21 n=1 Tax=Chaetomium strumarium TaxID=1170767 RepID=A0AAJ0GP43_9PEZI|nr:altered inheritance of mitochondria protein 21 [Chaetomium strumarium]
MSAATAKPPAIPPRPSRGQEKTSTSGPMVPPRPNRRFQRSVSPNPDRFAPSPLNDTAFLKPGKSQPSYLSNNSDPIPRSTSVDLPSLGEEGKEYAGLAEELSSSNEGSADPEQTRTVPEDLKLHAPKPSLPAESAKQRVMAVTRTDSERAASFGIGRPSSVEDSTPALPSNRSLKKKASTTSQLSAASSHHDDEHGIPQIGQQVPMLKYAGDVQAPSPAPAAEGGAGKHHKRRTSSRGNLPPGSYGLHGHGVAPQDKLEKAYYEKHPDLLKKEHVPHHYDRPNDFSMSRDDLDKIVKETASRGSGLGVKNYAATPSDQVGWQALEETASRIASPDNTSPELKTTPIHVDEPGRPRSVMFSDTESVNAEEVERPYKAPILAEDEIAKDPSGYDHQPAVEPPVHGVEEPSSRPTSRPTSLYKETSFELRSTPLEDVEEYEPLFKDDEKQEPKKPAEEAKPKKNHHNHPHRFPSADIWEDAPSSVFYTAEVSTPELFDEQEKPVPSTVPPPREGETPAQAFARHQEELAEREARGQKTNGFLPLLPAAAKTQKPLWAQHQKHLTPEAAPRRPGMQQRFPSRDVWEDVPDSLNLQTTVSTPQQEEEVPSPADNIKPPELPSERPTQAAKPSSEPAAGAKPSIPDRPKPRQASVDDKPAIPERPKPQIPARPAKAGPTSGGLEPAEAAAPPPKQKPAVPARPMGSKIAALAGGFMNDLNRRLQLGPQAPPSTKKEEPAEEEEKEEKEKAPLSDVRKGRARGPQRRAPASSSSAPKAEEEKTEKREVVTFAFSSAVTFFEIDPDEGTVSVHAGGVSEAQPAEKSEEVAEDKKNGEEKGAGVAEASSVPGAFPAEEGEKKEDVTAPAPAPAEAETEKEQATEAKAEAKAEPEAEAESEKQETKSLATNMAGETLVSEQIKKDDEHQEVEPVKVVEN